MDWSTLDSFFNRGGDLASSANNDSSAIQYGGMGNAYRNGGWSQAWQAGNSGWAGRAGQISNLTNIAGTVANAYGAYRDISQLGLGGALDTANGREHIGGTALGSVEIGLNAIPGGQIPSALIQAGQFGIDNLGWHAHTYIRPGSW